MADKQKNNNDMIFDNSFATMVEESPALLVPLINEVFGTSYSKDDAVVLSRDSHHTKNGVIVTDVLVNIRGIRYHIECQSYADGSMQIRMLEYDFAIAIEHAKHSRDYMEVNFPKSCVLQLRSTENTPDRLEVKLNFQDGSSAVYTAPVVKVDSYTLNEMLEKDLLMLVPFYSLRYEESVKNNNSDELSALYDDMADVINRLQSPNADESELTLKRMVLEIFVKICYYIGRKNEEFEGRMDRIMSDNPLNLETVRSRHEGIAEGKQEDIIELLEDCGEVGDSLKKVITDQTDIPTLKRWIKIAARVSTIDEFESEIDLVK